jgi:hypothetical protein
MPDPSEEPIEIAEVNPISLAHVVIDNVDAFSG